MPLFGVKAIDVAVAAAKDDLRHASQDPDRRRGPLAMMDVRAGQVAGPEHFARMLVHGEEAGGVWRWDRGMCFIDAIAGRNKQRVFPARDAAGGQVVLRGAEALHHVESPDDIGFAFVGGRLSSEGSDGFVAANNKLSRTSAGLGGERPAQAWLVHVHGNRGGQFFAGFLKGRAKLKWELRAYRGWPIASPVGL